jgi:hypothetical protein
MKNSHCVIMIVLGLSLAQVGLSQTYLWPLEAEPAITSTFCEYRPGHFHSGIDLKTWGRVGLNVYAVDDGYVWRIKVSPWGSGRALYLKLADGRCAVYFHLSGFAPFIQAVVEGEQERVKRYSIDFFPKPWEMPVSRGQVVAFSGESGTGGPHLHFEVRDSLNRPLNPMKNGFPLDDSVAPTVTGFSLTPLGVKATIEDGHRAIVVPVRHVRPGFFQAERSVRISGPVGLGIRLYDRADAARNRLAVYGMDLYVDERLRFRTRYDQFSFSQTRQVDLDRDFSLIWSGQGRFQRLYRVGGNELPFYVEIVDDEEPDVEAQDVSTVFSWTSEPGWHTIRVIGMDAEGNASIAEMEVLVDHLPHVTFLRGYRETGLLKLEALAEDIDDEIQVVQFSYSTDFGESWTHIGADSTNTPPGLYEAEISLSASGPVLCRAEALDSYGVRSPPRIYSFSQGRDDEQSDGLSLQCEPTFHESFVEWTITGNRPLIVPPQVTVIQPGGELIDLELVRSDIDRFSSVFEFRPNCDGKAILQVRTEDQRGFEKAFQFPFDVYTVTREFGGNVRASCGRAGAVFQPQGVYTTLWARIESDSTPAVPFLPLRSGRYRFHPLGVSFDKGATVTLKYDSGQGRPERIGLYRCAGGDPWSYVGAAPDTLQGTVSAVVRSFGCFALLEDTLVPEVWGLKPKDGSQEQWGNTVLFARVRDRGSGIGREEDLVMELDDQRVISEYDPEGNWLTYVPKRPLSPGSHTLRVTVTDMAGNVTVNESRFSVLQ